MITMRGLSRFIAEAVASDVAFKTQTQTLTGSEFAYYVNVDAATLTESVALPYFSVVTFNDQDQVETKKFFKTQILIGIARTAPALLNGVIEEESLDKLETLTRSAIDIVKTEMRNFGIQGDKNVRISFVNFYVPKPDGEEDLQMQIDLEFDQDKYLTC